MQVLVLDTDCECGRAGHRRGGQRGLGRGGAVPHRAHLAREGGGVHAPRSQTQTKGPGCTSGQTTQVLVPVTAY